MKTALYFVKQALGGQNQFASGGLLLMIFGAVGVYLRSLPLRLWSWLIYQTTMLLTVKDDDTAFVWIKEWPTTALVLNVGRNSLIAFLASEVVRQSVKLALLLAGLHPQIYGQTVMGLFNVVFVTAMLWVYRLYWQERPSMVYPLTGR